MDVAFLPNSPTATVEVAAFDAFWASDMPESDPFFADMAIKPVDLSLDDDEDAWLFGDKLGLAVRDIRVMAAEPVVKTEPPALSIGVAHHQDEDDTTSVLLEPIMGSPVDELDAMAAFMVDDVDPFQEVVVTSDDEPMSPTQSPAKAARARQYCSAAEEKKLDKLRATVAHLEKIYYARCHGRADSGATNESDVDILRVKTVRSVERLQRIACDVAQENYGFRAAKMPQRAREELFLHEMGAVLKSSTMREQVCSAIADKLCSDAIVSTAQRSAEAAMGLSAVAGESLLGWDCRKHNDAAGSDVSFLAKKTFADKPESDFERVTAQSWELLLASEQFAAFMKQSAGVTTRSHVLKQLSDDAILVAFDTVRCEDASRAVQVERDVCVAFRVRTTNGMMIGVSSMAPSLFETAVHQVNAISFVQKGMRWMQFSQKSASSFSVSAGGRAQCGSRTAADAVNVAALSTLVQWERELVAPAFQL